MQNIDTNFSINNNNSNNNEYDENKQCSENKKLIQQNTSSLQLLKDYEHIRWWILLLATIAQAGGFIGINFPAYLQLQLKKLYHINDEQYNLLITVQSLPNIILPFFIGYISSNITGPRICYVSNIFLVFLGQFLAFASSHYEIYHLMLLGRFFTGIGYTNATSSRQQIITTWFKGKELGFALGSFQFVGKFSVILSAYMFSLYQSEDARNIQTPLFYTSIICLISFTCALTLAYLDKLYSPENFKLHHIHIHQNENNSQNQIQQQTLNIQNIQRLSNRSILLNPQQKSNNLIPNNGSQISLSQVPKSQLFSPQRKKKSIILSKHLSHQQDDIELIQSESVSSNAVISDSDEDNDLSIIHILQQFPKTYWLISIIVCLSANQYFQTADNYQEILKQSTNLVGAQTVFIFLVPNFMNQILCPFLGMIQDKYGGQSNFLIISQFFGILGFLNVIYNPLFDLDLLNNMANGFLTFTLLGLESSIMQSLRWVMVSLLIPKKEVSFAVGILLSLMNLFQSIGSLITGACLQMLLGYLYYGYMMLLFGIINILLAVYIKYKDHTGNQILSAKRRHKK